MLMLETIASGALACLRMGGLNQNETLPLLAPGFWSGKPLRRSGWPGS